MYFGNSKDCALELMESTTRAVTMSKRMEIMLVCRIVTGSERRIEQMLQNDGLRSEVGGGSGYGGFYVEFGDGSGHLGTGLS